MKTIFKDLWPVVIAPLIIGMILVFKFSPEELVGTSKNNTQNTTEKVSRFDGTPKTVTPPNWLMGSWEAHTSEYGVVTLSILDEHNLVFAGDRTTYTVSGNKILLGDGTPLPFNKSNQTIELGEGYYFKKVSSGTHITSQNTSFTSPNDVLLFLQKHFKNSETGAVIYAKGPYAYVGNTMIGSVEILRYNGNNAYIKFSDEYYFKVDKNRNCLISDSGGIYYAQ